MAGNHETLTIVTTRAVAMIVQMVMEVLMAMRLMMGIKMIENDDGWVEGVQALSAATTCGIKNQLAALKILQELMTDA